MGGETDLDVLLAGLKPELSAVEYGFASISHGVAVPENIAPICLFREDEGLTVIAPAAELDSAGVAHQGGWAWIVLKVHSSLDAVGMTAAIAKLLGDRGISANVVAACYHDHVFVPWPRRGEAVRILENAAQRGAASG
jgi:hypothetical protein